MGKYFGTDGIRGKANETLTADRAFQVGRYLGWYFSQEGKQSIIIGKDTRRSSDMFEHALAAGITSEGCDVYLTGTCPTPMICHLTVEENFACGVMVSASHNPFADNGIKVFSKEGIKLPAEIEEKIEAYIDGEVTIPYRTDHEIGNVYAYGEGLEHYLAYVKRLFPLDLSGYKLTVDCANGSSSVTAERFLKNCGAELVMLNQSPDGLNINTKCGSTHPELMMETTRTSGSDLGLAFDGDADRMLLADASGNLLTGDHMLYALGKYLKHKGELTNDTVVTTVMANLGLFKACEKEDIRLVSTAVGDKYVYEKMCEENDVIGGEQSGHIIYRKAATTGDGLITALLFLNLMKETGKSAAELCRGLTIFPQLLVNVRVSDKHAVLNDTEIQKAIEEVNQVLDGNGRLLVRPSGTEPLLRVMAEAETQEICEEQVGKIADLVRAKYGI